MSAPVTSLLALGPPVPQPPPSLPPYRPDLDRFADIVFKRVEDPKSFVALRAPPKLIDSPVWVGSPQLKTSAFNLAKLAAKQSKPTPFSTPPCATFRWRSGKFFAGDATIAEGLLISAELDQFPTSSLETLIKVLGPPTVVVASGGIWRDAAGVEHPKLHAHWRLRVSAKTAEELQALKDCRWFATALVDGDMTGVPTSHPYRWPGSVHTKDRLAQRHARIVVDNGDDTDVDLVTALAALRKAWVAVEAGLPARDRRKGRFAALRHAEFVPDPNRSYDTPFADVEFEAVVADAVDRIHAVAHDTSGRRLQVLRSAKAIGQYIRGQDEHQVVERLKMAVFEIVRVSGHGDPSDCWSAIADGLEYGRRDPAPDPEVQAGPLVPTFPNREIPVDEARIAVEAAIRAFVDGIATRVRPEPNVWEEFAEVTPPFDPYVKAIRVTTGAGKTTVMAKVIAELVHRWRATEAVRRARRRKALRRPEKIKRVLVAVPTHKLGDEIVETFRRQGVSARVFRGRQAIDPERVAEPGKTTMCDDLDAVDLAMKVGASINESCCSGKSPKTGSLVQCQFYETCAYQRQKADPPDVWIVAHDMLFREQDAIRGVEIVIVDETFYDSGIRAAGEGLTLDGLEKAPIRLPSIDKAESADMVRLFRKVLAKALRRQDRPGGVAREHLVAEEIDADVCTAAISAEWEMKARVEMWPGMPPPARTQARKLAEQGMTLRGITALWGAVRELAQAPPETVSGRVFLDDVKSEDGAGISRRVRARGISRIAAKWRDLPTLLMDATLPDPAILRAFYPTVELIADIEIAHPHAVVRQVVGAPVSKSKLFPRGGGTRNLNAIHDGILRRYVEAGRPKTLVVVQQQVEDWLKKRGLPDDIAFEHFNNTAGLDGYKDVGLLICIGRTMPSVYDVEGTAGALTGVEAARTPEPTKRGQARWYDKVDRVIRTADGAGHPVNCEVHPDPVAEALRFQVAEAEVIQCIGRGRAINRTAANPLVIEVWSNLVLPITVDEVVRWTAFQAGADPRFEMIAGGVELESPTDAVAVWPERWASADAARKALAAARNPGTTGIIPIERYLYRDNSGCSVSYQPVGPKQHRRAARFDLALIPDPRGWLETRLGPLAHFEVEQPAAVVRLKLLMARSLFESLESTVELTEPWRVRREQVLTMLARAA